MVSENDVEVKGRGGDWGCEYVFRGVVVELVVFVRIEGFDVTDGFGVGRDGGYGGDGGGGGGGGGELVIVGDDGDDEK